MSIAAANYCQFRGLLMKSYVYMRGKASLALGPSAAGTLELGDHPNARRLAELGIAPKPLFTAFFPSSTGVLDDHFESWFLSSEHAPRDPARRARERDRPGARRGLARAPETSLAGRARGRYADRPEQLRGRR